jgi:N-acetylglucosamine kinase-like BadF-type ATPase
MILVADSGSTKTDWIAGLPGSNHQKFSTPGFNPFFQDHDFIINALNVCPGLKDISASVTALYFFGSGCSSADRKEQIRKPLAEFFNHAAVIVEHDMLGCALSVCEGKPGIACILGTGSNTCYFDGNNLAPVRHGLGYVLGDEGIGSHFGKKLLSAYIYKNMPGDLQMEFGKKFPFTKEDVLFKVYKQPAPNVYLASFATFLSDFETHPWIRALIRKAFTEFFETNVLSYTESKTLPVHFTGSIAYVFREYLKAIASENNIRLGNIIRKPVLGLADYFFNGGIMPGK